MQIKTTLPPHDFCLVLPGRIWLHCSLWVACFAVLLGLALGLAQSFAAWGKNTLSILLLLESVLLIHWLGARLLLSCNSSSRFVGVQYFLLTASLSILLVLLLGPTVPAYVQTHLPAAWVFLVLASIYFLLLLAWQIYRALRRAAISQLTPQIKQHSLFNTLNRTAYLCASHPELVEATLLSLALFYRGMLKQAPIISIKEEIILTQHYVQLEKIRLAARLRVVWNISIQPKTQTRVPAMLLQPLVENAIGHGIELFPEGGTITIDVIEHESFITFELGNPIERSVQTTHGGLCIAQKNLEQRLRWLYAGRFSLSQSQKNDWYTVKVKLPTQEIKL